MKQREVLFGGCAGGLTSILWFATEWIYPWRERLPLLSVPLLILGGFIAIGWLRSEFGPAAGYLLGVSPIAALPLLVLTVFGAMQAAHSVRELGQRLQRREFDATEWRKHADDGTRAHMVDDLVRSRKLEALTVSEAQAILGPPSGNLGGSECDLSYWLDTDRGWLCLSGANGVINHVRFREYDD